ncbi:MAG: hypothetical protein WC130_05095 [Kiritimatiellia bacterium]
MTNSLRNSILVAVDALLKDMDSIAPAKVYRSRMAAFAKDEFPAVVLSPVGDIPSRPNIAKIDWGFIFAVQVGVRAAMDEIPDEICDPILVEVHNAIMASDSLNELLIAREPGRVGWKIDDADMSICWATLQFEVTYRTNLAAIDTA